MPRPHSDLAHQSRGRDLGADEAALAVALERIFAAGTHDFAAVAQQLSAQQIVAPASRSTTWTVDLLEAELTAINASLDEAYAAHGFGA
ncbi:hypothetical protein CCR97_19795 [Rhodoplanes elegans]|uniref:Recombinase-like domain-containing protein n=1 Tax=Rhodoplanes elegans TaxID=29408 RepID=A0A327KLA2_9BRAD|nr:recombinase-like helix-turn-helix domain-containing protein [Rhodoplanes elegans]MBK5960421.1 hypothetical protein [Rhodoplanes elegans]RAI38814.1 hypothetical protein CH338_11515 [Rhodoplanes elegans]